MPRQEKVNIQVQYLSDSKAEVTVEPSEITIFYDVKGKADPDKYPRSVRWVIRGAHEDDHVVIRPKPAVDERLKTLFRDPSGQGYFEATGSDDSIDCGPPDCGTRSWEFPLKWEYEAIVRRDGTDIGICDPAILIEEDPHR